MMCYENYYVNNIPVPTFNFSISRIGQAASYGVAPAQAVGRPLII